jgi:hypothetical protein
MSKYGEREKVSIERMKNKLIQYQKNRHRAILVFL